MKKCIALISMIACILGLAACGSEKKLTAFEQQKVDAAISMATEQVIPNIQTVIAAPDAVAALREYTSDEVKYFVAQSFGIEADGNVFISALDSFATAYEQIGGTGVVKGATAEIDGKSIIVNVDIEGPEMDARAEIILSNDFFLTLESASLNKVESMGDMMGKAALNTVLGMGTVFAVLILISLIISALGVIPKIQAGLAAKKGERTAGIEKAVEQIARKEEIAGSADDLELVAVIAAAIAASEGAASTDGFVVRSIRRRRAF